MFGFHSRNRSLIPVADMEKLEEKRFVEPESSNEAEKLESPSEPLGPGKRRNLTMIYLLFLAQAIMAASLSSQTNVILPSSTPCSSMDTVFLRSILQCAYYFGTASGLIWGYAADRLGRKRFALMGLFGMTLCCLTMGFATSFAAFSILRFIAGTIGSAAGVSALAMLADSTHGSHRRVQAVALIPLLAACGEVGPLFSTAIQQLAHDHLHGVFADFPGLASQIACFVMILSITIAETLLLEETLPGHTKEDIEPDLDSEKAAFLGGRQSTDSEDSLSISIIEALNDDAAAPPPSRISINQMFTAPSILFLLISFALLSLHSSTFDIMLPHIGHTSTYNGGMELPCSWQQPVMLVVKMIAGVRIMHFVPLLVSRVGLLPFYRRISMAFPALYILIPTIGFAVNAIGASPVLSAIASTIATLAKATLAGAAEVLVLLLVLAAAPDASSTGTLIGVVSVAELFKALAVGLTGISYFVFGDYSMLAVNSSLWVALACLALMGAGFALKLRETPRLGSDLPAECFYWQNFFDTESEDEAGF